MVSKKEGGKGEQPFPLFSLVSWVNKQGLADRIFRFATGFFALLILALALAMTVQLCISAWPAVQKFGFGFLFSSAWDPVKELFGALPYVYGTVASSLLALLLAVPLGLCVALFLTELSPYPLRQPLAFLVETLVAIPSVVYGLWGIFALAPFLRVHVSPFLIQWIGKPFFAAPAIGLSLFTAGIILAIMIVPTIVSISREVFETVPNTMRESALALGTTRWEMIRIAVLKPSKPGMLGAIMLALGRALGETMAVAMVIGNKAQVSPNLLAPAHSMASVIANEFSEATGNLYLSSLIEIGLLLMVITLILNVAAHMLIWLTSRQFQQSAKGAA